MKELRDSFDHLAADAKAKVGRSGSSSSELQPDQAGELPELKQPKRHWWGGRKKAAPKPTGDTAMLAPIEATGNKRRDFTPCGGVCRNGATHCVSHAYYLALCRWQNQGEGELQGAASEVP